MQRTLFFFTPLILACTLLLTSLNTKAKNINTYTIEDHHIISKVYRSLVVNSFEIVGTSTDLPKHSAEAAEELRKNCVPDVDNFNLEKQIWEQSIDKNIKILFRCQKKNPSGYNLSESVYYLHLLDSDSGDLSYTILDFQMLHLSSHESVLNIKNFNDINLLLIKQNSSFGAMKEGIWHRNYSDLVELKSVTENIEIKLGKASIIDQLLGSNSDSGSFTFLSNVLRPTLKIIFEHLVLGGSYYNQNENARALEFNSSPLDGATPSSSNILPPFKSIIFEYKF